MNPPLVFVTDLSDPELGALDRHHLEKSRRMRFGDEVVVADGHGSWRAARFGAMLSNFGPIVQERRREPAITVVFAPVKGDRPDWMVGKLAELGVDRIIPMTTRRSVVRWDGAHDLSRLRRIAKESAMQSRQPWLPTVQSCISFVEAVSLEGACVADQGGATPSLATPTVLIGPEGGWDESELSCELLKVRLGSTVLRAETAAVTAAVLLGAMRGALVVPAPHV